MTFALIRRAQPLQLRQSRISRQPVQRGQILYSWHLSFVPFFYEANETLGVQSIIINNKSNPLLPQYYLLYDTAKGKATN